LRGIKAVLEGEKVVRPAEKKGEAVDRVVTLREKRASSVVGRRAAKKRPHSPQKNRRASNPCLTSPENSLEKQDVWEKGAKKPGGGLEDDCRNKERFARQTRAGTVKHLLQTRKEEQRRLSTIKRHCLVRTGGVLGQ